MTAYSCTYGAGTYRADVDLSRSPYRGLQTGVRRADLLPFYSTVDDPAIADLGRQLLRGLEGREDRVKAAVALSFVQQNVEYASDEEVHGAPDLWALPAVTLELGRGDCDCMASLFVSVAHAMGLDAVTVLLDGHMAPAVCIEGGHGACYEFRGRRYYHMEATDSLPAAGRFWGEPDPLCIAAPLPPSREFLALLEPRPGGLPRDNGSLPAFISHRRGWLSGCTRMRFIHVSDLHLGKTLFGYPLIEDQRFILGRILQAAEDEDADAVVVAGDVYDKGVPPVEAVRAFNGFLSELHRSGRRAYIVPGNHDSADRVAFASSILSERSVFIAGPFSGAMERQVFEDGFGEVDVWMLPFVKRSAVQALNPDRDLRTPDDAFKAVLDATPVDPGRRNVLVAHQFFGSGGSAPEAGGSEAAAPAVGGADCISCGLLDAFDYVALGHIHRRQAVGRDGVRYSGSPLKYSESESGDAKAALCVDLGRKGEVEVRPIPLAPLHDLRTIEGTVDQLVAAAGDADPEDYVYVRLTEDAADAKRRLDRAYSRVLSVDYSLLPSEAGAPAVPVEELRAASPSALFADLFRKVSGKELSERQLALFEEVAEECRRGRP